MKKVSICAPMYNEEEMAPLFLEVIRKELESLSQYEWEIVLVNDGSKDNTLNILKEEREKDKRIHIVSFSRNFGHEAAVAAALKYAKGDAVIIMDADLQDPPSIMKDLLAKWEEGYKVVNAKRVDRKKDSWMKRNTAAAFYKVIWKLSGKTKVPENVGNYRLMDRVVVNEINALKEKNRVFRVMVPYVGYKTTAVEFKREERPKGHTHYNYNAMFALAGNSITSASIIPLKWSFKLGLFLSAFNGFFFMVDLVLYILNFFINWPLSKVPFGTILILLGIFLSLGIILIFIGIASEYIGRIMVESQNRPTYFVDENIENVEE